MPPHFYCTAETTRRIDFRPRRAGAGPCNLRAPAVGPLPARRSGVSISSTRRQDRLHPRDPRVGEPGRLVTAWHEMSRRISLMLNRRSLLLGLTSGMIALSV